jgi:hypothetical protein
VLGDSLPIANGLLDLFERLDHAHLRRAGGRLPGDSQLAEVVLHEPRALCLELMDELLLAFTALRPRLFRPIAGGGERGVQLPRLELVDVFVRKMVGERFFGGL